MIYSRSSLSEPPMPCFMRNFRLSVYSSSVAECVIRKSVFPPCLHAMLASYAVSRAYCTIPAIGCTLTARTHTDSTYRFEALHHLWLAVRCSQKRSRAMPKDTAQKHRRRLRPCFLLQTSMLVFARLRTAPAQRGCRMIRLCASYRL